MAKHESTELTREDFDAGPSSADEIEPSLYLGNLTAATDVKWLKDTKITHILTVDSCPLPRRIQLLPDLTVKYIQLTDMPREDFLPYFDESHDFIDQALTSGGKILVHCYFGVSRSSTLVIAYMMKKYEMTFDVALDVVKSKRRFVSPNSGFVAQLKLYGDMGCTIDTRNVQFKMYRLQIAADKVRKARILPSTYVDLIKPDPALETVRPEPTVYRCKKCRRIVATASNILPHAPGQRHVWRYVSRRGDKGKIIPVKDSRPDQLCDKIYFIEPIAWMPDILHNVEGKLNCPKCEAKLGSFSWISGCQCPCSTKIAPAFYLVPSKVEWSNAVQNVLVTV
uniref:Dusp12_0 protein n=1 Tax=Fopius arisanus TaxID=64838 RepID=A0A0C9PJ41_9HYME